MLLFTNRMWKATAGQNIKLSANNAGDDEWETDPDFVNDVSEKEQRWGAKTVEGSGHVESLSMQQLRDQVKKDDDTIKKQQFEAGPKPSHGYGGKFGVEKDKMDKSAVGHDYQAPLSHHVSQTDGSKGFGGKFGVQEDRKDASAAGWDHHEQIEKHASQTDYAKGFGGKFGVQTDRVDKSAVGYEHKENLSQHSSQKDHSVGFGGKYGVQSDRVDKSAKGWSEHTKTEMHPSQTDHKKGFGGKFGVETDKVDKSAKGWSEHTKVEMHPSQTDHKKGFGGKFGVEMDKVDQSAHGYGDGQNQAPGTNYEKTKPVVAGSEGAKNLKAKFENFAKSSEDEDRKKADEQRANRQQREKKEKEESKVHEEARVTEEPDTYDDVTHNDRDDGELYEEASSVPSKISTHIPAAHQDEDQELYQDAGVSRQSYSGKEHGGVLYETAEDMHSAAVQPNQAAGQTATALYDYQATDDDELSFDPGEIIIDIEFIDDGWWKGSCNGRNGLFPSNYVELQQ